MLLKMSNFSVLVVVFISFFSSQAEAGPPLRGSPEDAQIAKAYKDAYHTLKKTPKAMRGKVAKKLAIKTRAVQKAARESAQLRQRADREKASKDAEEQIQQEAAILLKRRGHLNSKRRVASPKSGSTKVQKNSGTSPWQRRGRFQKRPTPPTEKLKPRGESIIDPDTIEQEVEF